MRFERSFTLDRHGKRDWENSKTCFLLRDDKLYGWAAREDDYNGNDIVGEQLRKECNLSSVSQLEADDKWKMDQFVESMYESIEANKKCTQELQQKVLQTSCVLENVAFEIFLLNKIHVKESGG